MISTDLNRNLLLLYEILALLQPLSVKAGEGSITKKSLETISHLTTAPASSSSLSHRSVEILKSLQMIQKIIIQLMTPASSIDPQIPLKNKKQTLPLPQQESSVPMRSADKKLSLTASVKTDLPQVQEALDQDHETLTQLRPLLERLVIAIQTNLESLVKPQEFSCPLTPDRFPNTPDHPMKRQHILPPTRLAPQEEFLAKPPQIPAETKPVLIVPSNPKTIAAPPTPSNQPSLPIHESNLISARKSAPPSLVSESKINNTNAVPFTPVSHFSSRVIRKKKKDLGQRQQQREEADEHEEDDFSP